MRLWWSWSEICHNMDYILIFWLVSTYLKSVNRNWQPCILLLLLLLHCGIRLWYVKRQRRRLRPFYLSCVFCWQTHYYFSSKFAPNITYDLAGVWWWCVYVYLSDGPTSMLEANTNKSNSKLSRFQSSFRFTRLLKRPKRLHTWGPVFLFWQIIKYYSNISLIVL